MSQIRLKRRILASCNDEAGQLILTTQLRHCDQGSKRVWIIEVPTHGNIVTFDLRDARMVRDTLNAVREPRPRAPLYE